jgi:shikimate dehydrogenase
MTFYNLYGVTGNPILHSRSPYLFSKMFDEYSFLEGHYMRVATESPEQIIELIKTLGMKGMNITSPFKQSIIPFLDDLNNDAKLIGAVNTVKLEDGKLIGYNTDYLAVSKLVKRNYNNVTDKKCLVIGAGGAARAAVYAMVKDTYEVTVINRTDEKANAIAEQFKCNQINWSYLENAVRNNQLIINTTPFKGIIRYLSSDKLLINAVYDRGTITEFLCKLIQGDNWLVEQAYSAFKIFTGFNPKRNLSVPLYDLDEDLYDKGYWEYFRKMKDNISLIGFIGSGKTAIGMALAEKLNWDFVDTDDLIETQENMTIQEIFDNKGEEYFRQIEIDILKSLSDAKKTVISTGGGIIFEDENRELLKKISNVYWLFSPLEKCIDRIQDRNRPPLDNKFHEKIFTLDKAELLFNMRVPYYCDVAECLFYNNSSIKKIVKKIYEEDNKCFGNRR